MLSPPSGSTSLSVSPWKTKGFYGIKVKYSKLKKNQDKTTKQKENNPGKDKKQVRYQSPLACMSNHQLYEKHP